MILLMLFALIAGAGTAITPCVLPVLPAMLSASAAGGRRRPLGIGLGLAITFTIAIVALVQLVKGVGLAAGAARTVAIVVLILFGVVLLIPELAERIQAPLSRLARFGPANRGTGFWSGVGAGGALGFVCAPCAGPILAAVTSVSATSGATAQIVLVALSYAVGLSAVMLVYGFAGRAALGWIRRRLRGDVVERALGVVLLATGVAMVANLDVRFEEALARDTSLPAILVDPTRALESSHAVQSRLAALRPQSRFAARQQRRGATPVADRIGVAIPGVSTPSLPDLGPAPPFTGTQDWFNTPGGRPLTLAGMRGHVVLVDFWTYTCINCIRTLPALRALDAKYRRDGLTVVGVHTPEFPFEHDAGNVAAAIRQNRLRYPVVQDNDYGTWDAYQNQYWPAEYLIDGAGNVRYVHFGEGHDAQTEAAIRALLVQAGARRLGGRAHPRADVPTGLATPETYLGTRRARGWVAPWAPRAGTHRYPPLDRELPLSSFALSGAWRVTPEGATAVRDATVHLRFQAKKVYLVLTPPPSEVAQVGVRLDGKPLSAGESGADVFGGSLTATRQRLYELVALPVARRGELTVTLPPGVSAYAFTFG